MKDLSTVVIIKLAILVFWFFGVLWLKKEESKKGVERNYLKKKYLQNRNT